MDPAPRAVNAAAADACARAINLDVPFDRPDATREDAGQLTCEIAAWLCDESGTTFPAFATEAQLRDLTKRLLTVRPPQGIPEDILQRLDLLLAAEARRRDVVTIPDVLAGTVLVAAVAGTATSVWRGDITRLAADAIVNAANRELLGCFRPFHACIDNAIHAAAGPRLRADCARIMALQAHAEPTGHAKITRGYHLPARYVLHTVGPIVGDGVPAPEHEADLARCYEACLELAASRADVRTLAFCSISTGVFGYPKEAAAIVATRTVTAWLERHPARFDAIVFDVFTADDDAAYRTTELFS
jgi:O-acetyl-ADP-ribose deacetylase (regulator of RNase III)